MPYFSIIIPVYKVQDYIRYCLYSLKRQTFQDFEVILVDDGSPDECPRICDDFVREDSRFSVIHKLNEGPQIARKTGVSKASGNYVAFIDSDDWIDENWLEYAFEKIEKYKSDILAFGYKQEFPEKTIEYGNKIEAGIYNKDRLREEVYPRMLCTGEFFEFGIWPSVWSKIFKCELFNEIVEFVDEGLTFGEDAACTYLCLYNAESVCICDKAFYHYRYVPNSLAQMYDADYWQKIERLFRFWDQNNEIIWGKQLVQYKMFLLLMGINKEFLFLKNIAEARRNVEKICSQNSFAKVICEFECDDIKGADRFVVNALKDKAYGKLQRHFFFERYRKTIKNIIKGMYREIRKI